MPFCLISGFFLLIVLIPDLTAGINRTGVAPISYLDIIETSSLFAAVIYFFVLCTNLRLAFTKQIMLKWWRQLLFTLAATFIATEIIFYFVNIGQTFRTGKTTKGATTLTFTIFVAAVYLGYYLLYVKRHMARLKRNHPVLFAHLTHKYAWATPSPNTSRTDRCEPRSS